MKRSFTYTCYLKTLDVLYNVFFDCVYDVGILGKRIQKE